MNRSAKEIRRLNAIRAKAQRHADSSDSLHMRRVCRAIMVELNVMLHPKWRVARHQEEAA
ncbi:MAG: hypothetical protein GYB53_14680 [Rhodobacteraceae bacterium]|uniref:hypothetical protein n=1 Tax=Oceanicola sp. S124 TaxID=1042378 RepID=UPI0002E3CCB3|nr:hypothetical protein [Oceanicola sp. S124]MBR9764730.1 hypothetical protein [Paracoccaceae bacterium]MBR9819712.1 hypothetical protein [Paracoccaceae bacterium]